MGMNYIDSRLPVSPKVVKYCSRNSMIPILYSQLERYRQSRISPDFIKTTIK